MPVLPAMVIGSVLLITVVGGLAEPTGDIRMDAIAYHYLGPRVWLRNGLIRPVLDECQTSFPAVVEVQYAALMRLGGQRAPDFFAVIGFCSILLITAGLAGTLGLDPPGIWWAVALVATMPVVYRGTYGGFIDIVFTGFILVAVRIGFDAERMRHFVLLGMFCGFAMGTKYTGLISWALLVGCAYLMATLVRGVHKRVALHCAVIGSIVAIAVAAGWYIRDWVLMGSPIYPPPPFFSRFFHVRYLPPQAIQHFIEIIHRQGVGMGHGPLSFLLLPYNLTYHTASFINGAGGIGLAPLALAPFGILATRRNGLAEVMGLYALLQTAAWFMTDQEARFVMPVYIILAVFAVLGWRYVTSAAPQWGPFLAGLAVATSIAYGLFMIGRARIDDMHAVVSSSFAENRRQEEIPFVDSFDYLNREPEVTKVLILDPLVPPYYSEKDYVKPIGRLGEESLPNAGNLDHVISEIPRLHISHVLDVRWPGGSFRLPDNPEAMTLVLQRDNQRIYRVDAP